MERTAIESPRRCFGLEQNPDNPLCPDCPHRGECAAVMGYLSDRVSADQAYFNFVPHRMAEVYKIDDLYRRDLDLADIENVYGFCHDWVFGSRPRGRVGRNRDLILRRIREAETTIKLFFLANMYGWKISKQHTLFNSKVLTLGQAVTQVKTFASACQLCYGTFDTTSLDMLVGAPTDRLWIEERLYRSEIIAGDWIVRYKLFNSDSEETVERLYRENEEALDPHWLAIEQTYWVNILRPHLKDPDNPDVSPSRRKHRWHVSHILGQLKRKQRQGLSIFLMRERIMPRAVNKVLALRGFSPGDFMVDGHQPITSALKFWNKISAAVAQWECINFVDKNPSAFDRFKIGSD